jgi:hypothetical protein
MDDREKFFLDQKIRLNSEIIKILAVIEFATITGVLSSILATNPLHADRRIFAGIRRHLYRRPVEFVNFTIPGQRKTY